MSWVSTLIEKMMRPGLLSPLGTSREKACQKDLSEYFRLLAERLPVDSLSKLVNTDHPESAIHAAEITIKNTLRKMRPALIGVMATHMLLAWKHGYQSTNVYDNRMKEAETSGGPFDKLGTYGQRAADYAATNAAELVKGLDETTLELLQDIISDGIEDRIGVDGLARKIREGIADMSRDRAQMIATTEMNKAMSHAALEKLNDLDVKYKQWIPVDDPCDICSGNEDDGPIPVDDSFSSGDDAPPAHPRCRCAVAGARAPES